MFKISPLSGVIHFSKANTFQFYCLTREESKFRTQAMGLVDSSTANLTPPHHIEYLNQSSVTAVNTYQRVEEIILQSQGRPRSTGSDSCSSTNDRTVRPYDQEERPISGLINRGLRQNGGPAMTSTPGIMP